MQIAQVMAGYSLGEADLLRRAMGKKIRSEMEKQRAGFVAGAVRNGVPKRAGRHHLRAASRNSPITVFNKSHAAAYAFGVVSHRLHEGAITRSNSWRRR